jgi:hypothetical protein
MIVRDANFASFERQQEFALKDKENSEWIANLGHKQKEPPGRSQLGKGCI